MVMARLLARRLSPTFLLVFFVANGLGFYADYAWDMLLPSSILLGVYCAATLVSIALWRAVRGNPPEEMMRVFGTDTPEIITAFDQAYRRYRQIVLGGVGFGALTCGGLMVLWLTSVFPAGLWEHAPTLVLSMSGLASICGAIAGPGFVMVILILFRGGDASELNPVDE